MSRLVHAFLLLVVTSLPGTLRAWSPELHRAIIEAALDISPAAAARIPSGYLESVLTTAEGDRYTENSRTPFQEAQTSLDALLAKPNEPWSRNRAIVVGRLLHFVSHASIARSLNGPVKPETLFSGREVAVFRVRGDNTKGLRETLAAALLASPFSDDPELDMNERFRDAANLVADTLLRLPGPTEEEAGPGPALFIYDPIDNGMSGARLTSSSSSKSNERDSAGILWEVTRTTYKFDMSNAGKGSRIRRVFELPGVNILEWRTKETQSGTASRVLLFNNSNECYTETLARSSTWTQKLGQAVPSYSLRVLEFTIPQGVSRSDVDILTAGRTPQCAGAESAPLVFPLKTYKPVPATATRGPNYTEGRIQTFQRTPPPTAVPAKQKKK